MKTCIPKQPKHTRERIEAKLDARTVRQLERYCEYLESDRDYVLSQMLELIFRKDKGFAQWLASNPGSKVRDTADTVVEEPARRSLDRGEDRPWIGGTK